MRHYIHMGYLMMPCVANLPEIILYILVAFLTVGYSWGVMTSVCYGKSDFLRYIAWVAHSVQMSQPFSTNEPTIQYK